MDVSSVNSDLIRGNVTTIILNSLADGDRYGYDILKEIEERSEGKYKLKQATLYKGSKKAGLFHHTQATPTLQAVVKDVIIVLPTKVKNISKRKSRNTSIPARY